MNQEEMQARYDELCAKDDEQGGLSPQENQECVDLYYELQGEEHADFDIMLFDVSSRELRKFTH